jgi:hypothetical protein
VSGPVIVAGVRPALTVEQRLARAEALNVALLGRARTALDYLTQKRGPDVDLAADQLRAAIAKATGGAS